MKFRKKTSLLFGVALLVIFGGMYKSVGAVKSTIVAERKAAAETVETGFNENLAETFENINYATRLSGTIDLDDTNNLDLFQKNAQKLIDENEHVMYAAYFKKDTLDFIYPMEQFDSFIGRDMADFPYSVTLAKVVIDPVVEGPTYCLFDENEEQDEDVFLFMQAIYAETTYVGEIVVAMDSDYVLSGLGLDVLEEGNYDYELWRVDFLGQYKTVIATSDASVDFSDAVKRQISSPVTWNISVLPKGGWITSGENTLLYIVFIALGFIILGAGVLLYYAYCLKKKLEIARYTDSDSGLCTMKGFFHFVDNRLSKNPNANMRVLYLQLGNFRKFTKDMERNELVEYLMQFKQRVDEHFKKDAIVARMQDDSFLIAIFTDNQNPDSLIEEFILQLYWKRRVNGNKVFIDPRYCTVTYPEHGRDAASLADAVTKQFALR